MKIDVREIKRSHGLSRQVRFESEGPLEGLQLAAPVVADLKLTNVGSRVLVTGSLESAVRLECSRCAADYVQPLDVEVDEQFLPHDSPEAPSAEEVEPEQLNVFTYENEQIELDEVIRQNLVASLPFKPLCAEDCQGLCSQCGANLNETPCQCEVEEPVDPRWAALKNLKQ